MDYKPPFTITNAILKYVASISEKLGKLNAVQGLEYNVPIVMDSLVGSIESDMGIKAT